MSLTTSGLPSSLFCRGRVPSRRVVGRERRTVRPWLVSCSCCVPAFSGMRCPPNWAAAARPAGAGWASGMRPGFGPGCTGCCWSACTTQESWTGAGRHSTAQAWRQKRGCGGWPEPDGSRQAGHQAPRRHRCPRHAARHLAERRQPPRQHDAGGHAGRRAGRAGQRPRQATQAPGQAACRQGLRPPSLPSGVPGPRHHAAHRTTWRGQQRPSRAAPMGGGAQLRLARPFPAPEHTLRATRRPPPRLHNPRLRRHLHAADQAVLSLALSVHPGSSY